MPMEESQLKALASKIDDLIELCSTLERENRQLKSEAGHWQREREQLMEKTDLARNKVEAMIGRLRALEQES